MDLVAQQAEATLRCEAAQEAVEVAKTRLDEALAAGRDTTVYRRALTEAHNLTKAAFSVLRGVDQQIKAIENAANKQISSQLIAAAKAEIEKLLEPFDLKKWKMLCN